MGCSESAPQAVAAGGARCPQGHLLRSGTVASWQCNNCGNHGALPVPPGQSMPVECRECDYDLCAPCFAEKQEAELRQMEDVPDVCPQRHRLHKNTAPDSEWICNECNEAHRGVVGMRCEGCDYDLCLACYRKGKGALEYERRAKLLQPNPHFPAAELDLLAIGVVGAVNILPSRPCILQTVHFWATVLRCDLGVARVVLSDYLATFQPHRRMISVVVVACDLLPTRRLGVPENTDPDSTGVEALIHFFNSNATAHTLVLEDATVRLITAILEAHPSYLRCLILVSKRSGSVLNSQILRVVADHPVLEELPVQGPLRGVDGEMMDVCSRMCGKISFKAKPDLTVPPPSAAAALAKAEEEESKYEFVSPVLKSDFGHHRGEPDDTIGLVVAGDERHKTHHESLLVPLNRAKIHCFLLLPQLLEHCDASERLIPIQIQPPVSPEVLALAVHFVTCYVSEEAHEDCVAQEEALTPCLVDIPRCYWDHSFEAFYRRYFAEGRQQGSNREGNEPTKKYSEGQNKLDALCELMAVGAYLNCPALKRFVRTVLATDKLPELSHSETR